MMKSCYSPILAIVLLLTGKCLGQTVDFSFSIDPGSCNGIGNKVTFTNLSDSSFSEFEWWLGNGDVSNEVSPVYTFPSAGTYEVFLFASNASAGNYTKKEVVINGNMTLAESITVTSKCPCNEISLEASGDASSWTWNLGDGTTEMGEVIAHTFPNPGNFEVTLSGTDGECEQTVKKFVQVCPGDVEYSKSNNHWIVGGYNKPNIMIDFNSGDAVEVPLPKVFDESPEGVAVWSDEYTGELMLYCTGDSVFDKNHDVMVNGRLEFGDRSSSQTALIIPQPNSSLIYIFTSNGETGDKYGFYYHIVDMALNGGLGEVVSKDNILFSSSCHFFRSTPHESMIASRRGQCPGDKSYWLVIPACEGAFRAYLIDENGLGAPVTSSFPSLYNFEFQNTIGAAAFSPNGNKIAIREELFSSTSPIPSQYNKRLALYDFDPTTGKLSNPKYLLVPIFGSTDFSADGSKLYAGHFTEIGQMDLESQNIQGSHQGLSWTWNSFWRQNFSLGPNGKIYSVSENLQIDNPNDKVGELTFTSTTFSGGEWFPSSGLKPGIVKKEVDLEVAIELSECTITPTNTTNAPNTSEDPCSFYAQDELNFEWHFGDGTSFTGATPPPHIYQADGVYEITVTMLRDKTCQAAYDTFMVELIGCNTVTDVAFESDKDTVCLGETVRFTMTSPVSATATYLWNFGEGATPVNAVGRGPHDVVYSQAGSPLIQLVAAEGSTSVDTVRSVFVVEPVEPNPSNNGPYCHGQTIKLSSGVNNGAVNWTGPQAFQSTDFNPQILEATTEMAGYYTVEYRLGACILEDSTLVEVMENIVPEVNINAHQDQACEGALLTFTLGSVFGQGDEPTFSWLLNGSIVGMGEALLLENGVNGDRLTVQLQSSYSCAAPSFVQSDPVVLEFLPAPVVNAGLDRTIRLWDKIQLEGEALGASSVLWSATDSSAGMVLSDVTTLTPTYNPSAGSDKDEVHFILQGFNDFCSASDTVKISLESDVWVPNAFSPNGDENHDVWVLLGLENYPDFQLHVYNRWGSLVYKGDSGSGWWDGTRNGEELPQATYFYVLKFGEEESRSGHVSILR